MFLVSTMNMSDRLLIGIVAEPVKHEFGLSDSLFGLLSGTVFAFVYPPLGLPIARLADRFSRKGILAICLALWSIMTLVCGVTTRFWMLVVARAGVAAGEAGYAPASHALITDMVGPRRRASAFSVLVLGIAAGGLMASVVGGWVAQHYGWRSSFLVVGAPGILVAFLVAFTIREPARVEAASPKTAISAYKQLLAKPTYTLCILGSALHLMVAYGLAAWTIAFFVREHGLSLGVAGALVGGAGAIAAGIGGGLGGLIADWLGVRDRRWLAWWPCVTVLMAAMTGPPGFLLHDTTIAIVLLTLTTFLNSLYMPATYALVQTVADPRGRASAAALMIFVQNFIGLGFGPLVVGMISDFLAPQVGVKSLGYALAMVFVLNGVAAALYFYSGFKWTRGEVLPAGGRA
jgi:predicted MFS family arabinose efflux permease